MKHDRVPEEERSKYDEEIGGFESEAMEGFGCWREIPQGWTDTGYHGTIEFHTILDGSYISLDAKFTDGQLVKITRNE